MYEYIHSSLTWTWPHLWPHNSGAVEDNLLYIILNPPSLLVSDQLAIHLPITNTERAHLRTSLVSHSSSQLPGFTLPEGQCKIGHNLSYDSYIHWNNDNMNHKGKTCMYKKQSFLGNWPTKWTVISGRCPEALTSLQQYKIATFLLAFFPEILPSTVVWCKIQS